MAHDQTHGISGADHTAGTNGTLVGTEAGAVVEKAFGTAATASTIVQRGGTGNITLPSTDPAAATDAASKDYVDKLITGHRSPVTVLKMRDDSLNSPPGGEAAGDAFVVGPVPAGAWAAYTTGDIVEWSGAAWVLVLAAVGGEPVDKVRVVVHSAGLGGSFAAQANKIGQYDATANTWSFTSPNDGDEVAVVGEGSYFENTKYIYDAAPGTWVVLGGTGNHNALSGLQGGGVGEYYHFTSAQHTELSRYKADVTQAAASPSIPGTWGVGDRGIIITTTGTRKVWWCYVDAGPTLTAVRLG